MPTEFNLAYHQVLSTCMCYFQIFLATTCHLVFFPQKFTLFLCRTTDRSFLDVIYGLSKSVHDYNLRIFCILSWAVWGEICHKKHDEALLNLPTMVNWASTLLAEFQNAFQTSFLPIRTPVIDQKSKWIKVQSKQFIMDFYARFNDQNG